MISLILVVVFASLVAAYNEGDACFAPDPMYYGYYAPHPVYCHQYLQCTHGRFIARNCAPGLHWNVKEGACDWPSEANCEGQTTIRTTTEATTPTTTTEYDTTTPDYEATETTEYETETTEYETTDYTEPESVIIGRSVV